MIFLAFFSSCFCDFSLDECTYVEARPSRVERPARTAPAVQEGTTHPSLRVSPFRKFLEGSNRLGLSPNLAEVMKVIAINE